MVATPKVPMSPGKSKCTDRPCESSFLVNPEREPPKIRKTMPFFAFSTASSGENTRSAWVFGANMYKKTGFRSSIASLKSAKNNRFFPCLKASFWASGTPAMAAELEAFVTMTLLKSKP